MLYLLPLIIFLATAFSAIAQELSVTLAKPSPAQQAILEGVGNIQTSNNIAPGAVCFFGENAFPILLAQTEQAARGKAAVMIPMAAATQYGKGRTVIFGHSALVGGDFFNASDDNKTLCYNLITWLAGKTANGKSKPPGSIRVAVVGEQKTCDFLKTKEVKADFFRSFSDDAVSAQYDVLIINAERIRNDDVVKIDNFVKNGGGLMAAATGWGWQQLNPAGNLRTTFAGNKLVAPMGLVWTDQFAPRQGSGYAPALNVSKFLHPKAALDAIIGSVESSAGDKAQIIAALELTLGCLPEEQAAAFSALHELVNRQAIPTKQKPIVAAEQPLDRLAILMQTQKYMRVQTAQNGLSDGLVIPKLAAASEFPGDVPKDAPRVSRTMKINSEAQGWQSTGLYAAPGDVITVTIPKEIAAQQKKFSVRIGALTDRLWHLPRWERCPEISLAVTLTKPETKIVNPFGGHVYVISPQVQSAAAVSVQIAGAVESPYYVLGTTTDEQWKQSRQAPGPWAELASDRLIITVPAHLIRELDNPKAVMEFWNDVLDGHASLAAWTHRKRPERIVADRQISAGWMHSGYPIGTPTQTERGLVDLAYLKEKGDRWGFFHELGHNHQSGDWTFSGSGEVTVNLFTLYTFMHQYNTPPGEARRNLSPESRKAAKAKHIAAGAPFEQWKSQPFLALMMYVELIDEFGWDAFKKVFAEYRDLPANERPRNDDEKRDQWMRRFSKTVGKNLGPFFYQWGVPVSQGAKDAVSNLPVWLPE
ncbi:MAG: M60 family metallopeptidase [Planctomycetaceae bacterium]|nr:M60 family metallopeptidase [Planctomycetaceae bacterium]